MKLGRFSGRYISVVLEDEKYQRRCRKLGRAWLIRVWRIRVVFTTRPITEIEMSRLISYLIKEIQNA